MKKLTCCSFLLLLPITFFCLIPTQKTFAQDNYPVNEPTLAWVNLGMGPAGGSKLFGVGLITNGQYASKAGLFGVRYFKASDTLYRTEHSNRIDDISELSITYGYSHNLGILNLSASAGLGALWGKERGAGADNNFSVLSFPVQGNITIQPVPFIGLGVMVSTTINSYSTVSGAHFVLQFGRLR